MQTLGKWLRQQTHYPLVSLLVMGLLLRGTIAFWLPPGFDESYYYLYTRHLDWSYFDHPVLVALTTGFGVWLTGEVSQFTIRLSSLLLYTGSLLLLYLTSLRLFSKPAALLTVAIASIIPIFQLSFGVLTLPDGPLIFFWTATLYVAAGEFFRQPDQYQPSYRLAIVGLLIGLACLGKYHGLALGLGMVGFCLTSHRHRIALRSPWTWLGVGLFAIALLPIVLWNAQHDWVSLRFQSGRAVPDRAYSVGELVGTWLVGIAYLFPTLGFPLWWVSGRSLFQQVFRQRSQKKSLTDSASGAIASHDQPDTLSQQWLILWTALPLMLVFTLMGGYRAILPTWPMPGFWSATLLLGVYAADWQRRSRRTVQRWLGGSAIVVTTILLVALLHVTLGTLQKPSRYAWFGGFLAPSTDASTQFMDIRQIRQGFAQSPTVAAALQKTDFLFTNDLYLAGQIGMAIAPLTDKPITCFDRDLRGFAFWSDGQQWVGRNGLYISIQQPAEAAQAIAHYNEYFARIQKVGEIPIERGGVTVQTIQIYQAQQLLKPYPRNYGRS